MELRQEDNHNFAEVLGAYAYDPLLRINRIQEWEKAIIYETWRNPGFKNILLNGSEEDKKNALKKYILQITPNDKTDPPSWIDDLKICYHENTDDTLHIVIPQADTKKPLGY